MTETGRSAAVGVAAVLLGFLTSATVSLLGNRSVTETYRGTEAEFNQLSATQQEELVYAAERFAKKEPAEQEEIRQIHEAVVADEALKHKLTAYHSWWEQLDRDQRTRLKEDGQFNGGWRKQVDLVYREIESANNMIVVRSWFRRGEVLAEFTEADFAAFLDEIIPQPVPASLQSELDAFAKHETCERTLTRIFWFFENRESVIPKTGPGAAEGIEKLRAAVRKHLLTDVKESRGSNEATLLVPCFGAAVGHYAHVFHAKRASEKVDYANIYETLEAGEQLDLLRQSTQDVERELVNRGLAEDHRPEIAKLSHRLSDRRKLMMAIDRAFGFRSMRSFGGGERRGSGGDRNGFGGNRDGRPGDGRGKGRPGRPPSRPDGDLGDPQRDSEDAGSEDAHSNNDDSAPLSDEESCR